jgi:hypothetical protein
MYETKYIIEKENNDKELEIRIHESELLATPGWIFLLMLAFSIGAFLFMVGAIFIKIIFN